MLRDTAMLVLERLRQFSDLPMVVTQSSSIKGTWKEALMPVSSGFRLVD
jgi:hypothetical protein